MQPSQTYNTLCVNAQKTAGVKRRKLCQKRTRMEKWKVAPRKGKRGKLQIGSDEKHMEKKGRRRGKPW